MKTFTALSIAAFCVIQQSVNALPTTHQTTNRVDSSLRAEAVKEAFKFAWDGYSKYAYGHDELMSITNRYSDSRNGWGATIVDGLDTMLIMGLENEYAQALDFVQNINWTTTTSESKTFETCIRYLGGLLSAYDLRPNPMLLRKAEELANQVLLPAFNTPNGIPASYVNVSKQQGIPTKEIILAEFALQLEFVRLSQLTNNPLYERIGNSVIEKIAETPTAIPGLYPIIWEPTSFLPTKEGYITIAGGGDSYYEYLLKTHILMDNEKLQLKMWEESVDSMVKFLRTEAVDGSIYLAEISDRHKYPQSAELICFLPGNLLLGAQYLRNEVYAIFAQEIMDSCFKTWEKSPTGLSPEAWTWIDKFHVTHNKTNVYNEMQKFTFNQVGFIPIDKSYQLRPETIESLFYFYRLTGDPKYQDMAWRIFESLEKYCKVSSGYTSVNNIMDSTDPRPSDFQESFFFAETLKYLYLIFSDPKLISLDEYVFNTEAHPFKLPKPIRVQAL